MGKLSATLSLLLAGVGLACALAGPAPAQTSEDLSKTPKATARPVTGARALPAPSATRARVPPVAGKGYPARFPHEGGFRWGGNAGLAILPLVGGALLAAPGLAAPPPLPDPDEPPPPQRRANPQPQAPAPRLQARVSPPPPGELASAPARCWLKPGPAFPPRRSG